MVFPTLGEDATIVRRPFVNVASDGSALARYEKAASGAHPNPRSYGCFPKLLRPGWHADVTVPGPATVADTTTFELPESYPDGIVHIFVNGEPVVPESGHTGTEPDRVLYAEAPY